MTDHNYCIVVLRHAFSLVEDPANWKNRIDAVLTGQVLADLEFECATGSRHETLRLLHHAVVHFTGSVPKFSVAAHDAVRVEAAGYYEAIGA